MLLLLLCSSLGVYTRLVSETRCWPGLDLWFDLIQLSWRANFELCDSYLQTLARLQENADCCQEKPIEFSLLCMLCQTQTDSCLTEPERSFIWTSPCSAQYLLSSRLLLFLFKQSGKQNFFWCRLFYYNHKAGKAWLASPWAAWTPQCETSSKHQWHQLPSPGRIIVLHQC